MKRVIKEYQQLAASYDQKYASYNSRTLDITFAESGDITGKTLVDIGCGSGLFLEKVKASFDDVTLFGVDLVPEMLELARERLDRSIELLRVSATHLPFDDNTIDIAVSTSALHYFPDQTQAIREIYRVLKPGGKVVITDWCNDYLTCKFMDTYLHAIGKGYYQMLGSSDFYTLLRLAQFNNIHVKRFKVDWIWGMMTGSATKKQPNSQGVS